MSSLVVVVIVIIVVPVLRFSPLRTHFYVARVLRGGEKKACTFATRPFHVLLDALSIRRLLFIFFVSVSGSPAASNQWPRSPFALFSQKELFPKHSTSCTRLAFSLLSPSFHFFFFFRASDSSSRRARFEYRTVALSVTHLIYFLTMVKIYLPRIFINFDALQWRARVGSFVCTPGVRRR